MRRARAIATPHLHFTVGLTKSSMQQRSASIAHPNLSYQASCVLPTPWADFHLHAFLEADSGKEHLALTLGDLADSQPVLARLHSECLTGDTLFSQRCDCGAQLEYALKRIAAEGRGILLYLRQEGRGIGLVNKIRAYALQEQGADTVEANHQLGFADDLRNYQICGPMFQHFGIKSLRLMTNNPRKLEALKDLDISIERVEHITDSTRHNSRYLHTKASKLGHLLPKAPAHSGSDDS
jgi:GTP cyclohydrolase II